METFTYSCKEEECEQLVQAINHKYGYDFSQYSKPSLYRRINRFFLYSKTKKFADFKDRLLVDELFFEYFLQELTVTVTEMFRDPSFFKAIVNDVFPVFKNLPFIRIWHAGCSTGQEAYSLAILLKEHELLGKCRIYATDINSKALDVAKKGIYPVDSLENYELNYIASGGKNKFSDYYTTMETKAMLNEELIKPMAFAMHNLASDQSFNAFHLIICRNVLIYFSKDLQDKVLTLFTQSLDDKAYLALGSKESIRYSDSAQFFDSVNIKEKIWQKIANDKHFNLYFHD